MPSTNRRFWKKKLAGNKERDQKVRRKLRRMGWDVLTVWECQTKNPEKLRERIVKFLES